ncbi:MAG: competence/damage-inducible protein A [Acidimicrobiaceae bacterium]|jgi:nicotinamide-nucleotide amidase|nr:competence/damage-inducible protein A [Acidimicrobiaceae bacterium]|tara:strand:+ start:3340 stop:4587 length:1248 start_codon:yes stop_codon:yes gene_type:complete
MRCEVVAVGTELLLGQIVDTNSSWIGEQLALAGIDCLRHTAVGDNPDRIRAALQESLDRSDAVIVTGGLGPTQDDITRDVIAEVMGVEMIRDPNLVEVISSKFKGRGRPMPENNLRQADLPEGATPIKEMPGTAPGLICPVGKKVIYAVPGVPLEMRQMIEGSIIPDLVSRSGEKSVIRSRVLRTWGQSESGLAEMLAEEIKRLDEVEGTTLAFLASGMEGLKVRITAKAPTEQDAEAALDTEESQVRTIIGPLVFGIDDENMETVVLEELVSQGLTLATAESMTGGLIATRLTEVPGSSRAFLGSVVSYANSVKQEILKVPEGPVISEQAVLSMAIGVCEALGADVSVAVTGVAGPDSQEGQEPGVVWIGTCVDGEAKAVEVRFPYNRTMARQLTVITALDILRRRLLERALKN